jgi:hypothetical protein
VYWLNKNTGAYIPLKLSPGGSCSIKILFTDKQYYQFHGAICIKHSQF